MSGGGTISAVDWDEIMRHPAVTEVTTMTLTNTAERHDAKTDERLLRNMRARAPRFKQLLDLSMEDVNAGK